MDPIEVIQLVAGANTYFYAACQKMQDNYEECRKLCTHVNATTDLILAEYKTGIPQRLAVRLSKLTKYVCYLTRPRPCI